MAILKILGHGIPRQQRRMAARAYAKAAYCKANQLIPKVGKIIPNPSVVKWIVERSKDE